MPAPILIPIPEQQSLLDPPPPDKPDKPAKPAKPDNPDNPDAITLADYAERAYLEYALSVV